MAENKWWMTVAASVCFAGCVAPADGAGEQESTGETGTSAPTETIGGDTIGTETAGTETVGDDGVSTIVECSEHATQSVSKAELATNGRADAEVGLSLLGALGGDSDNVLLSPLSLRTAFGQVHAGATGKSRGEIEDVFAIAELGDRSNEVLGGTLQLLQTRNAAETEYTPELIFRPANRSFFEVKLESNVNPDWAKRVQQAYGVCFEYLDLNVEQEKALAHINGWVADQTNDLIPELVGHLPPEVSLVLVNALYFRASWATPFEDSFTSDRPFTTYSGESVEVATMHAPALDSQYAAGDTWEAVAIPYSDSRLELVVVLPAEGAAATFEEGLDAETLDGMFDQLAPTWVDLALPKFAITSEWALRSALEGLGMTASFTNAEDFVGIAEGIYPIYEVFHDVAIAIDEKGTEAAAATAVVFGDEGSGEPPLVEHTVVVDRTFYVAIRDREARSVLFFARIGNPGASK